MMVLMLVLTLLMVDVGATQVVVGPPVKPMAVARSDPEWELVVAAIGIVVGAMKVGSAV